MKKQKENKVEVGRIYGECPQCEEKELVNSIGLEFQCNKCGCMWTEIQQ